MGEITKPTVLIIDDDEDYLEILKLGLNNEFNILTIRDFQSLKNELHGMRPSLILLDMHLADTKSEDIIQLIRNIGFLKSIPIYMVSGSDAGRSAATELDLDGFMLKPASFHEIRDMLRVTLNMG